MSTAIALPQQQAMIQGAVRHLIQNYTPKGNKVGWLMMASILVEAWDLYSIAFVLIFIRDQYNPDPFMLGLAAAGTQGGAMIGALIGGWLSDKIGRRVMILATMVMFIVLALAQAFVPDVTWLIIIRFLLGIPLGSDISTGYTTSWSRWPRRSRGNGQSVAIHVRGETLRAQAARANLGLFSNSMMPDAVLEIGR